MRSKIAVRSVLWKITTGKGENSRKVNICSITKKGFCGCNLCCDYTYSSIGDKANFP